MTPIVSIDVGTSHIRAAHWSRDGRCVYRATHAAPALHCFEDGRVEQPLAPTIEAVDRVVAEVCGDERCVVALTTQRGTTVLVDDADRPLTPILSWQDRRAGGIARWFDEHDPDTAHRVARQASLASVLVRRWTGQWAEHASTRARASLGRPTSEATQPMICTAGPFARGSTLVAVGGDKNSELYGAGATRPGRCAVSFGTALSMGTLVPSNAKNVAGTFRTPSALRGFDTVEVGLPAGGVMAKNLGGPLSDVTLPPVGGVMCVPYFSGSLVDPRATGRFVGLDVSTDLSALYAAWLESLVLELVFCRDRLGRVEGSVGLCGGGATVQFAEWLATALEVPAVYFSSKECGLFGAALLSMQYLGNAAAPLEPLEHHIVHPKSGARWRDRIARYSRLVGDTAPV